MAFSYDTGASPSRRSRQTWPALIRRDVDFAAVLREVF